MVSIKNLNLIKIIIDGFRENCHSVVRGPTEGPLIFGARFFIFTGDRTMIDKFLNAEYKSNPTNRSDTTEGHNHTHIHADIQAYIHIYIHRQTRGIPKTTVRIQGNCKPVYPSKSRHRFLHDHKTFSYYMHVIIKVTKTHCVLITEFNRLMLFREIILVYSESYMEHTYNPWAKLIVFYVKARGTHSQPRVLQA
jgi:hypothetical protein